MIKDSIFVFWLTRVQKIFLINNIELIWLQLIKQKITK